MFRYHIYLVSIRFQRVNELQLSGCFYFSRDNLNNEL